MKNYKRKTKKLKNITTMKLKGLIINLFKTKNKNKVDFNRF